MRTAPHVAGLAIAGLLMVGCNGEQETDPGTPATGDEAERQVEEASQTIQREADELTGAAERTTGSVGDQQIERILSSADAETRKQLEALRQAVQNQNWEEARSQLAALDEKTGQLSPEVRQFVNNLRSQVTAGAGGATPAAPDATAPSDLEGVPPAAEGAAPQTN